MFLTGVMFFYAYDTLFSLNVSRKLEFIMQEEVWTIKRLLEWTTDYLKKNGSDSPRLEAEILLSDALACKRIELYTQFEHVPDEEKRAKFRDYVKRRAKGEPVAYLVGYKEFYSLNFQVDSHVLIPRPETEHLVVESLDILGQMQKSTPLKVCDVGTGSGVIAVTIAKHARKCEVTAIDISSEALNVAQKNAKKHSVSEKITFLCGDLFDSLSHEPLFDLIVSNPPYVSEAEYEKLMPDVKNFEPKTALLAENHGTAVIRRLIEQAHPRLMPQGVLLVELSPMISREMADLVRQDHSRWDVPEILRDLAGLERILKIRKRSS